MSANIGLRDIRSGDHVFLREVYASTRESELAPLEWTSAQKNHFLTAQFDAQHHHYTAHYSNAQFQLILNDSEPIGRLYVDRREDEIRIIDIALLPQFQGAGIGTYLLKVLIKEAQESARPLTLNVIKTSPAVSLYQRLGFQSVEDDGVYVFMRVN